MTILLSSPPTIANSVAVAQLAQEGRVQWTPAFAFELLEMTTNSTAWRHGAATTWGAGAGEKRTDPG